jgi:hypothetical protein
VQQQPEFPPLSSRSGRNVQENGAKSRDPPVACLAPSSHFSNLNNPAHVIQTADDGRMHALVFDKVTH